MEHQVETAGRREVMGGLLVRTEAATIVLSGALPVVVCKHFGQTGNAVRV